MSVGLVEGYLRFCERGTVFLGIFGIAFWVAIFVRVVGDDLVVAIAVDYCIFHVVAIDDDLGATVVASDAILVSAVPAVAISRHAIISVES